MVSLSISSQHQRLAKYLAKPLTHEWGFHNTCSELCIQSVWIQNFWFCFQFEAVVPFQCCDAWRTRGCVLWPTSHYTKVNSTKGLAVAFLLMHEICSSWGAKWESCTGPNWEPLNVELTCKRNLELRVGKRKIAGWKWPPSHEWWVVKNTKQLKVMHLLCKSPY